MSEKLAIDLDEETLQRLSFIGETVSQPQRLVAEEAVRAYTREKERYIKAVRKGQDDIQSGRIKTQKELLKELESRLADLD